MRHRILTSVTIGLLLWASGCATKKYVRNQLQPVSQKVDGLESATNQKFAATDAKIAAVEGTEIKDVSQLNERISTTEMRLAQTNNVATGAQTAAAEARAAAANAQASTDANARANAQAISNLATNVTNSLNFKLVQTADVMFGSDKSALTPEAKTALDEMAAKTQSLPRFIVEVVGFTDKTGSAQYNLELSQRRAESVERYLITQKVPIGTIHVVGMGEEDPPRDLVADATAIDPNNKVDVNRLARRVHVRILGASDIGQAQAAEGGAKSPVAAGN